ncbi:DMSO/TMAO reductase YedYZ molybdopterin-dependent catalytic subunit [Friedmanniella endophytica]|uniref:DMSO/TMAO reductase YedYZ molybdopterin-dependent catalytic subunit n=1 Tax=Microlunatus kandeliicorticis TaxID=1759536 RepID=A0A7W3P573_9ACTN|nr:molybdopterin-dependent oxidoreductase [Microlunatus kandeliicorticis]MBA8793557.1 DMSO/TMAO reductase YedYZ molybdopterin-dependent catalytic subunit [Microlunatus kandeliicorticis]
MVTTVEPETQTPTPSAPARGTRWAALTGLIGGAAGLAVAELVAAVIAPLGAPLTAAGQWVISVLPAPLINFGKDTLGTADKPILVALVAVVVLALAALAGVAEYRRVATGLIVFAVLTAVGLFTVSTQPDVAWNAYLPTVLGLGLGYLVLWLLVGRLRYWRPAHPPAGDRATEAWGTAYDRRSFLRTTGILGVLSAVGLVAGRMLAAGASAAATARSNIRLPRPTSTQTVPGGADLRIPGISPYVSANDDFYRIDTALQVPNVDPASWQLTVTGMVENPITLTFDQLLAKPMIEHVATLTCVSNEVGGNLAGNAVWLGWPIRELLAQAKPKPGADMVLSRSVDGFTAGTPLSALTDDNRQALLAVGMNGEPLPAEHGFPVRMVVPGLYGYVSATKWVTNLKVTTFADDQGYWTPLGWSARGPVKLASRIDTPSGSVKAGTVAVGGVAWDQHVGIAKVEVQVDGGAWNTAKLAAVTGPDTWRQWTWAWPATPGKHTLTVRATNADGELQTAAEAPPAPDGATGYHTVDVTVR